MRKWILVGLFLFLHALICVLVLRTEILIDSLHLGGHFEASSPHSCKEIVISF